MTAATPRSFVWGPVVAFVAIVAAVALLHRGRIPVPPPPAPLTAAELAAPRSLVDAANAAQFYPVTEMGVGRIEDEPAAAARPPANRHLLPTGSAAPPFRLATPQGRAVALSELRGKAVLLEFFATWCPHCNAEAPHLRALAAALRGRPIAFLAIDADGENAGSVFAFDRYYGLAFPSLLDPSRRPGSFSSPGSAGPVTRRYRVEDYPTFYVLTRNGRVAWRSDGEQPDALLRAKLVAASQAT
jgi:thiol-disulfide isomerase/thioredoxin